MDKPEKPKNLLPSSFGGIKINFSNDLQQFGYEPDVKQILGGANLNYWINATGKNFEYNNKISDFICNLPINNIITVNENNKLVYKNLNEAAASMPIGIIYPLVCAANYTPYGALPVDGAEYSKAQFSGLWDNYLTGVAPRLAVCTYAQYKADIETYGQCAKFAVDLENEKFKVPLIKDGSYITQAKSDSELAKAYNESLPNVESELDATIIQCGLGWKIQEDEALSGTNTNAAPPSTGTGSGGSKGIRLDLSKGSSSYQNNARVQGDNVRLRYFVQVAGGEINQSQMDWSQWASGLSNKAGISLDNITPLGKNNIISYLLPDWENGVTLSVPKAETTYTAPSDGWFCLSSLASAKISIKVNGVDIARMTSPSPTTYNMDIHVQILVRQGDVISFRSDIPENSNYNLGVFFPCKGALE